MTKPNDPVHPTEDNCCNWGLSIREDFAARIMAGFAADPETAGHVNDTALKAVVWADALIRALNVSQT